MLNNKLFNYHVSIITEDIELLGNDVPVVLHNDFYDLKDEIERLRKEKEITSYGKIDKKLFRTYFYNDFDINNKNVNKLIDAVKQLPFSYSTILDDIKICAMLDEERGPLVYFIQVISNSYNYDVSNILELLDKAMDEIPSGVLNGLSRNQLLKLKQKELEVEKDKLKNYKLQEAACLSKEDAKLFYKLYFALLEFTNEKYNINKHLKIYNRTGINPNDLTDIVDTFWENKDELINEFCTLNPYKFNNEELDLIKKFKEGKRGMYFIMKYEEEYTTFMYQDRIYMVKGINVNIDNIIPQSHSFAHHCEEKIKCFERLLIEYPVRNKRISGTEREKWGIHQRGLTILDAQSIAPTITNMPDDYLHYQEPRIMTVRECARIQSFPDWFEFKSKYTTGGQMRKKEVPRYSQVGNAIPPLFAQQAGLVLKEML